MASKRKLSPNYAAEPVPLATAVDDLSERFPGVTTADQLSTVQPPPPTEPQTGFVERVRPDGPSHREPDEPVSIHTDVAKRFRLVKDGRFLKFIFDDEPSEAWNRRLDQEGFFETTRGSQVYASPASAPQIEAAYRLSNEFSGKIERYDVYRGR